jgi:2-oxoglutarate dehydrogenase E2 component (dihydrolipoamide succinyltransferase)
MAQVELVMPKMGESIMEATILRWVKQVGDQIDIDDTVLEIATDKVDSEVPSPVAGVLRQILYQVNDTVPIGKVIAVIDTEAGAEPLASPSIAEVPFVETATAAVATEKISNSDGDRFYSPLVRNIAAQEGIHLSELDTLIGSGQNGRVTKKDILAFVAQRGQQPAAAVPQPVPTSTMAPPTYQPAAPQPAVNEPIAASSNTGGVIDGNVEIIEMDRMRRLIADHMVMSKHTAPHVTSYVEADVTPIVEWRNRIKGEFEKKFNEKITFTPIFIEAIAKAIIDFPLINVSVDGNRIIRKLDINIGMATALPSGNLIVPVIKNADRLNLLGLTKSVNELANRARKNQLKPDEIQGGTFTLTNVGTFGNVMGTPIINQPQVAIMAAGAIRKKPAVVETPYGDLIAVRHMMFLSLSYDHRVVDGSLGGSFLRRVADYLESFDPNRAV